MQHTLNSWRTVLPKAHSGPSRSGVGEHGPPLSSIQEAENELIRLALYSASHQIDRSRQNGYTGMVIAPGTA
jgi:hypothetical protein